MKRRLLIILLFLLAGAVVNIGIAWTCTCCSRRFIETDDFWKLPIPLELFDAHPATSGSPGWEHILWWSRSVGLGVETGCWSGSTELIDERPGWSECIRIDRSLAGLPMHSLRGRFVIQGYGDLHTSDAFIQELHKVEYVSAVELPERITGETWVRGEAVLPLHPIWFGFVLNSILYAGVLWMVLQGPFVLRRHLRRKRGRCSKCGYDLRGELDTGCPECGWKREEAKR